MKSSLLPVFTLIACLLPLGCSDKDSASASGPAVDTSKSESAFASAEASVKAGYEKVTAAIRNTDWAAATAGVKDLAGNAKLSDEQRATLSTLAEDIKAKAAAASVQAREKAGQMAEEAKEAGAKAVDEAGRLAEKAKEATTKAAQDATKAVSDFLPKK